MDLSSEEKARLRRLEEIEKERQEISRLEAYIKVLKKSNNNTPNIGSRSASKNKTPGPLAADSPMAMGA